MTFALKLLGACTDTTLPVLERDQLLSEDNEGVRFLWDAAFGFSYSGGVPVNGAQVRDISENGNGSFVLAAGETVGFAGNGFDLSSMSSVTGGAQAHVVGPTNVWTDIHADQFFLVCVYLKLPLESDWNTSASLLPFFACSEGNGSGYLSVADPLTMAFASTSRRLDFRRQTGIGSAASTTVSVTGHYGSFSQVSCWRTASGFGASVRSAAGLSSSTIGPVGTNNVADVSVCQPRFGSVTPFTSYSIPSHRSSRNYRLYRGFVENLARSGRNPVDLLAADWSRTVARGVFS
jgi:hypothetical protein